MSDQDKTENDPVPPDDQESNPPAEQEEEIIFPNKESKETGQPAKKLEIRWSPLRVLTVILVIAGMYFAGYLTSPENMQGTVAQFKKWFSTSRDAIAPYQEKLTEAIETNVKKDQAGEQASSPMTEGSGTKAKPVQRKIKHWKAPMDPTYIRDKPGKSPMGMDLIPVYEDGGESLKEGQINIIPTVAHNIGVKTETVKRRTLKHEIRTVGNLTYDERKVHHIHTKYGGWIEKLYVDFTGQEVKQNDMLMEIYSPELVSTQEELVLALNYKESLKDSAYSELTESADSLLASTKRRLSLFDVPEHQIEALMNDKKITKTMHIHSPVRGFVIKKTAIHGMRVEPGMSLYMIADLSNIWVLADIYEYEMPWIKIGQKAEMNLSYFPGKKFAGKVTFIDPYLNPATRTLKVRMEFPNPKWELKPDMYANVTIKSTIAKRGLTVPEAAVIHSGEKTLVVLDNGSGQFESREVTLGVLAEGYYRVIKGLRNGDKIVITSNFLIDSESRLQEAIGKLQNSSVDPAKDQPSMKPPEQQLMIKMDHGKMGQNTNDHANH